MQIQVNSDKNIEVDSQFGAFVRGEAGRALGRFKDRLTRVEFYLSDVNGPRFGTQDKRCLLEARPARHRPLVVRATAATVDSAVRISLSKLRNALETLFARLRTRRTTARTTKKSAATATKPTKRVAAKKAASKAATSEAPASSGRSPKKKGIYQARRKSWPKR
jgi:hypothetical protein